MMGNWQEGEELAHDTFEKVLRGKWSPLPDDKLIYKIAHNACTSVLRKRHHIVINYLDDVGDTLESTLPGPEEESIRSVQAQELLEAISRLSKKYRSVLALVLNGLSCVEIGEILNIKESVVRKYRTEAYKILREQLKLEDK